MRPAGRCALAGCGARTPTYFRYPSTSACTCVPSLRPAEPLAGPCETTPTLYFGRARMNQAKARRRKIGPFQQRRSNSVAQQQPSSSPEATVAMR